MNQPEENKLPTPEDSARAEIQKEIDDVYQTINENQAECDKQILTLSSGFLAVALAFIKDVVPLKEAELLWLLISHLPCWLSAFSPFYFLTSSASPGFSRPRSIGITGCWGRILIFHMLMRLYPACEPHLWNFVSLGCMLPCTVCHTESQP